MAPSKYTVATTQQLEGTGIRQLRWENARLERLRKAAEEMNLNEGGQEVLPASRYRETRVKSDPTSTEIYFSPVGSNGLTAKLSEPIQGPTATQHNEVEVTSPAPAMDAPLMQSPTNANTKWTLRALDLDRLVVSLANAPMIQSHIQGETSDPTRDMIPDRPSFMSLRSTIREIASKDTSFELNSPSISANILSPSRPIDLTGPTRSTFSGLALAQPNLHAPSLSFWSHYHEQKGNIRTDGESYFLHIAFNSTSHFDCCLRIKADGGPGKPRISIFMQLTTAILFYKTGKRIHSMITEIDVTEAFRKAAFTEFIEQAGYNSEDVVLETAVPTITVQTPDESVMPKNLDLRNENLEIVNAAAGIISNLDPETCTMQTLTLMSELARIKRKYQDCVVVRCHDHHENGVPSRMSFPWISQHMFETSGQGHRISDQAIDTFRFHMIDITAKRSVSPEPFTAKVPLAGEQKSVYFVPLLEGASEKTVGWVCFIRDVCDVGL